jgi:hypothetical protein
MLKNAGYFKCKCGREGFVAVERGYIVSPRLPFGPWPCREHYPHHREICRAELVEWLEYFTVRPAMPNVLNPSKTEKLKWRLAENKKKV